MEISKNTIILDLDVYNELRDFKKEIENGKKLSIISVPKIAKSFFSNTQQSLPYTYGETTSDFYTDNKILEIVKEENENIIKVSNELNNIIYKLRKEINELKNPIKPELTLQDIKKLSIREFRKWKKQNN